MLNKLFLLILLFSITTYFPFSVFSKTIEGKDQILFIVNPISKNIRGLNLKKIIDKNLDLNKFEYNIAYTQYPQHATQLAQSALQDSIDIIAAVGGDGTVNEVGKALIHTSAHLAIIAVGSGNGLARHLGIPIGLDQGIKVLNHAYPIIIDTAKINNQDFLGIAGIGFDAHIAEHFAEFGKRGFSSYCQVALREFAKYKPHNYLIHIDGKRLFKRAFILTFANSSQYGNDFIIASQANIADGYLDLIIIDDIPKFSILQFLYRFKHGTLNRSHHFETYRFKSLIISHPCMQVHIDGDPLENQNQIKVSVQSKSLKILVPKNDSYGLH